MGISHPFPAQVLKRAERRAPSKQKKKKRASWVDSDSTTQASSNGRQDVDGGRAVSRALLDVGGAARLGLAAAAFAKGRPGAALRHVALAAAADPAGALAAPFRLRLALVYAQMAHVVDARSVDGHRADLAADSAKRPPRAPSTGSPSRDRKPGPCNDDGPDSDDSGGDAKARRPKLGATATSARGGLPAKICGDFPVERGAGDG